MSKRAEEREFAEFEERLEIEYGLTQEQAGVMSAKLAEFAAAHFVLCVRDVKQGLTSAEDAARDEIENSARALMTNVGSQCVTSEMRFDYDPRGTTVGIYLPSRASNSLTGAWKVPLDQQLVAAIDVAQFETPAGRRKTGALGP